MRGNHFKRWISWRPRPVELLTRMRPVRPWPVQMDVFPKGIDNTRIDVHLSPTLVKKLRGLVRRLIKAATATERARESTLRRLDEELDNCRRTYRSLSEISLKQRHRFSAVDEVRLFQLAVVKFLLQLVSEELRSLHSELETGRNKAQLDTPARAMTLHDKLVQLARRKYSISYQVTHRLFQEIERMETGHLCKLRKSLIGNPWPVPREALFNPLLQTPNVLAETEMMHHYPLLFLEQRGREHLNAINRLLVEHLKDYLPTWTQPQTEDPETSGDSPFKIIDRIDQSGFPGFVETEVILSHLLSQEEYTKALNSWLDDPDNLKRLLDPKRLQVGDVHPRQAESWLEFQRALRTDLVQALERMDLTPRILASYRTPRIYEEIGHSLSAQAVYRYLCGEQHRRTMLRRLGNDSQVDANLVAKILDLAVSEIRSLDDRKKEEYGVRLLADFLRLRRDLKLAYKTHEAMEAIHLLEAPEDTHLSRANDLLQAFLLPRERHGKKRIRNHVILKADVRGSTGITSELRARNLNPATHFSRNFFDPITKLLPSYGAEKVFVEGDAVILVIYEYSGAAHQALNVAQACGLGSAMLEVVRRQNMHNKRHGLPQLELGIGIAFRDEEPTFLYDEGHKITISPAINLADRLSSCTAILRKMEFASGRRPFHIEVLKPTLDAPLPACTKTDVLRYNVNGIELDQAAFDKLHTEIALDLLELRVDGRTERFHFGRYHNLDKRTRWLIVRESPVHGFDGERVTAPPNPKRCFYEAITDKGLIKAIKSRSKGWRQKHDGGD